MRRSDRKCFLMILCIGHMACRLAKDEVKSDLFNNNDYDDLYDNNDYDELYDNNDNDDEKEKMVGSPSAFSTQLCNTCSTCALSQVVVIIWIQDYHHHCHHHHHQHHSQGANSVLFSRRLQAPLAGGDTFVLFYCIG